MNSYNQDVFLPIFNLQVIYPNLNVKTIKLFFHDTTHFLRLFVFLVCVCKMCDTATVQCTWFYNKCSNGAYDNMLKSN